MDSDDGDEFFSKPKRQGMRYLDANEEDANEDRVPQASSIEKVAAEAREKMANFDEENLGEDFESTPWVPPSIEKALEYRINAMYRMGSAPFFGFSVTNAPDLSTGANLYFQFVYSFTIYFFFATILAIPCIVFCFFGSGIPVENRDVTNLYRFTIGNIGYDHTSLTYQEQSRCKSSYFLAQNTTCFYLHGMEYSIEQIAGIISGCEFLQVFLFCCVVIHLQRVTAYLAETKENALTSITDYTVMVRGLPNDSKEEDIINYFSELYALDKKDWRGRPIVSWAEPTKNSDNASTPLVKGTWVADCIIHRKIGGLISAFLSEQQLTEKLLRSRAQMKMYSETTCHAKGPNPKKYQKAEKEMMNCAVTIDMMMEKEIKRSRLQVAKTSKIFPSDPEAGSQEKVEVKADLVAAFITFEHSESFARCIEDYNRYSSFPWFLCFPKKLLFQGKKLKITKAPEPDEVVWENLEISPVSKFFRKSITFIFTLILICICFFAVLKSTVLKAKYSAQIPNLGLCSQVIPSLFNSTAIPSTMSLVRINNNTLDQSCAAVVPGSVYAHYVFTDSNLPAAHYSLSACGSFTNTTTSQEVSGMCPRLDQEIFCPCISEISYGTCSDCSPGIYPPNCNKFASNSLASCLCLNDLKVMIQNQGVLKTVETLKNLPASDVCSQFYTNYSRASALTYMSIFATLFINMFLSYALGMFNKFERHSSQDKNQGSLLFKLFISTFINMAFLVLIASGKVRGNSMLLTTISIMQGTYNDFTPTWYATVGTYFITMFVLQSITPLATQMVDFFISSPLTRCLYYPAISTQSSQSIVMQKELNRLEVAPPFDYLLNQTQLMTLLFFAMTYATGLPIIMPLCFFTFLAFFLLDKYAILYHNERPANTEDGVMKTVLSMLPYAAILRLGFGCWMLGHTGLFTSNVIPAQASGKGLSVNSSLYSKFLNTYSYDSHIPLSTRFILSRITKPHVFPLFILFIAIILCLLVWYLWDKLPIYWLMKFLGKLKKLVWSKEVKIEDLTEHGAVHPYRIMQMHHPLRQEISPFSSDYYNFMADQDEMPSSLTAICCWKPKPHHLTAEQEEEGWTVINRDRYILKMKKWLRSAFVGGITRVKGDIKRTYEIINEHGCSSYQLVRIPAYTTAAKGIKQGLESNFAGQELVKDENGQEKRLTLIERYDQKKSMVEEQRRLTKKSAIWSQPQTDDNMPKEGKEKEDEGEEEEGEEEEGEGEEEGEAEARDEEEGVGGLV